MMYIDLEMTETDLRDRLTDLGYGPEDDLSRLVYFQLPSLPDLDTDRGGQVLDALVAMYRPELVIIDTMARVVEGPEDDADTYRNFYKFSGTRLKQRGVSLVRLDHAGKDLARGQRGSSSKADDVDLVWQLNVIDDNVVLKRTHSRLSWVPPQVVLRRETEPNLRHVQTDGAWPAGTSEIADLLDEFEVPLDASVSMAMRSLKQANRGRRKTVVMAGLKWRRVRSTGSRDSGNHPSDVFREPLGNQSANSDISAAQRPTPVPGTDGNRFHSQTGTTPVSRRGTGSPGTVPDNGPTDDDIERWFAGEES